VKNAKDDRTIRRGNEIPILKLGNVFGTKLTFGECMFKSIGKGLVLVLVAGGLAVNAQAQENYFGGGVSVIDFSDDLISDDASLIVAIGRLGKQFNENISGELRLGIGVDDDSVSVPIFGSADIELDNMYGAYLRGGFQATDSVFPYAVVGYNQIEIGVSVSGLGSDSDSDSDVAYGVGADISLSETVLLNLEYMNYYDKDGSEIAGFTVGFAKKF